jgi:hypothetical protein
VRLTYIHDSTAAAARGIGAPKRCAVIALGSYMAIGFTETRGARLLPMSLQQGQYGVR